MYVARTVYEFCDNVTLATYVGDSEGMELAHALPFETKVFETTDRPTPLKHRWLDGSFPEHPGKPVVFEVCEGKSEPLPDAVSGDISGWLGRHVQEYDVVIAADFGQGMINQRTAWDLTHVSKYLAVNTQTNESNHGFNLLQQKYRQAEFACVDDDEIRLTTHEAHGDPGQLLQRLYGQMMMTAGVVTLGSRGCLVVDGGGLWSVPIILKQAPVDRIGAGDAFLSLASLCAVKGYPAEIIGLFGNMIGGLKCGKVCTLETVTRDDIERVLRGLAG